MVKRLCTLAFLLFSTFSVYAQLPPGVNMRFFTSFENPNPFDSTTSAFTGPNASSFSVETTLSSPAGGQSVRSMLGAQSTITLTTHPVSTLGQTKVWFDFNHIAKVASEEQAQVQISIDGGNNWTNLSVTNCNYLGAALAFRTRNSFAEFDYSTWDVLNPAAVPLNTWWKHERFDVSYIAANQADVRFRFRLQDGGLPGAGSPPRYGWLIDSVMITSAFSELVPPVINHTPLTGNQYQIDNAIFATINDGPGCDTTGILNTWAFFTNNNGPLDSVELIRVGTSLIWRDSIARPQVADGDTVCYYLRSKDSSPNQNIRYFPNQSNPGDSCISYIVSGPPLLNHTPFLGVQFSAGPFVVTASSSDASGIDSVLLFYSINGGAWQLKRMNPGANNSYSDTIFVIDGDTIDYYLESVDLSLRRFRTRIPDTAWTFIASGPPTITWPTAFAQCPIFLGGIFESPPFNIGVQITDASRIDTAFLYYTINNGPLDSVGMTRITTPGFCNWSGAIPVAANEDTICYYVTAYDSSVRNNYRSDPDTSCRQFVVLSGIKPNYNDDLESIPLWNASLGTPSAPDGWVLGTPAKSNINATRTGTKAWVVGPLNSDYAGNAFYYLESPVFDFSDAENPTLSFWMWRNISDGLTGGDALWIEYTTNIYAPVWTKLTAGLGISNNWYNKINAIPALPGTAGGFWDGSTNGYQKSEIRLTAPVFQNNPNKLKFRFVFRSTPTFHANGVAIDDISITRPVPVDVNVLRVVSSSPPTQAFAGTQVISGNPFNFGVTIRNFGQVALDTVPMVWELNGLRDTTILYLGPLAVNRDTTLMLDSVRGGTINCWSDIKVWSAKLDDTNQLNDTTLTNVYGIPTVRFPYLENFDSTAACNWLPLAIGSNNMPWERGTPAKATINASFSTPNAWVTDLDANPIANSQGYLYSPLFDLSKSVNGLLSVRLHRRFAAGSGLRITYSNENNNGPWLPLGILNDPNRNSSNWYNANVAIAAQTGPAFGGVSTTGYSEHILELPSDFNYRANRVRFRVEFGTLTTVSEGVAFDDFHLYSPPAVDVNLLAITRPVACPDSLDASDTIQVLVKNSGTDTLRGISFDYRFRHFSGTTVQGTPFTAPDTLVPAATKSITFPAFPSPPNAPYGDYTLEVYAVQANDGRRINDTLTRCVKTIPPVDLIMSSVIDPLPTLCYPAGFVNVKFVVRNVGNNTAATYNAYYKLDTLPPVMEVINRPLASNAYDTISMTVPLRIPVGPASLMVYVNSTQDGKQFNDSSRVDLEGLVPYDLPYRETNESFPAGSQVPYCHQIVFNAAGTPVGKIEIINNVNSPSNPSDKVILMGTASSGSTAWTQPTNPWDPAFQPFFLTRMVLPVITDARPNIHLRFRLLQIAGTNNNFTYLRVLANGVEVNRFQPTAATPATNPFATIDLDLTSFYTVGDPLIIEFQSKCRYSFLQTGTNRNGNLIDDITVYHSVTNSANIEEITYTPPFPTANTPVTIRAKIRNTGQAVLNSVTVAADVRGTALQTINFQPGIAFLEDSVLVFNTTFLPLVGSNEVCVVTSQPNGQPDAYTLDDSLCLDAIGFDLVTNYPYCNDFDQNQPPWLTLNPFTLRAATSTWKFGTPQKGHINGPSSGPNAWYIGADSLYGILENSALYTPIFTLEADSCYRVEFKSKWLTDFFNNDTTEAPLGGDGGTFEYSTDGGSSWDFLGAIDSIDWYVSYVQAMLVQGSVPFLPGLGWSGKSPDNYVTLSHPFSSASANQVLFRFRFASDNGFNGEGWSIDDFCFVKVAGPCAPLSTPQLFTADFDVKQNYPNPFDRTTTIEYKIPAAGKVNIQVRDMIGRIVSSYPQGMQGEGEYRTEIDLGNLNAGVYFYTVSFGGQQITKKMVISK